MGATARQRHGATRRIAAFRRESDLVELLSSRIEAILGRGRHTFVQAEWGLGPRIADLVVAVFESRPRPSKELENLTRLSFIEARIAAELLMRPLRTATVGERLRLEVDVARAALSKLERLGLAASDRGAWSVTEWSHSIPSEIVVFEAKLEDWRSAVSQAEYYRSFADRAFVAMPSSAVTREHLKPACRRAGVGLVTIEPTGAAQIVSGAREHPRSPARRRAFAVEVLRRYAAEAR